jgi:hypothetical protein
MENPSLQIGGGEWAVKETKLLGTNPVLNRKIPVEIDVTNATIGTRVNKEGFIENGPRNLLTFSENFDNAVWVKNDTVVLSTNNANPFGKLNATKLGFTLQNNPNFQQVISTVPGKVFTTSFYVRRVSGNATIYLRVGSLNPNNINPTSVWQRFSVTGVTDSTTGRCTIGAVSPVLGVDVIEIWGAQLEENLIATEYYPTTTRTNLARIDYSSGEAVLLIEPQRTNLVTYNNDPSQTTWTNSGATLNGETTIAPDGSIVKGYDLTGYLQNIYGGASGLNYVNSIWVKSNQTGLIGLRSPASGNLNLEITTSWRRISISALTSDTSGKILLDNRSTALPNLKVFVWGAQAEQGTFITSTIPTQGSAVTRNQDLITKTGISNLIGQTEGTIFINFALFTSTNFTFDFKINDGTNSNIISFYNVGLRTNISVTSNGVILFIASSQLAEVNVNVNTKIAITYIKDGFFIYQDGFLKFSQINGDVPSTLSSLTLGSNNRFYSLKNVMLYKKTLTNAQLIKLTTL